MRDHLTPTQLYLVREKGKKILDQLTNLPNHNPSRRGGYLTISQKDSPDVLLTLHFGEFSKESSQYMFFSQEKALRLWGKAKLEGHVSSWQSRNPEKEQYQGAVVVGDYIFSFSGFDEKEDEAFALLLPVQIELITLTKAREIGAISNNPHV